MSWHVGLRAGLGVMEGGDAACDGQLNNGQGKRTWKWGSYDTFCGWVCGSPAKVAWKGGICCKYSTVELEVQGSPVCVLV